MQHDLNVFSREEETWNVEISFTGVPNAYEDHRTYFRNIAKAVLLWYAKRCLTARFDFELNCDWITKMEGN